MHVNILTIAKTFMSNIMKMAYAATVCQRDTIKLHNKQNSFKHTNIRISLNGDHSVNFDLLEVVNVIFVF